MKYACILILLLNLGCTLPDAIPNWALEIEFGVCRFDENKKMDEGCKFN
jgi:hypothetical protein